MAVERAANIRVGISQLGTDPGRIRANTDKIIASIREAKKQSTNPTQKIDLLVFPELTIPGYLSRDLFLQRDFIKENKDALKRIAKEVVGMTAIVGFADYVEEEDKEKFGPDWERMRYNSAAIIQDGVIKGVVDKRYLPNDDTFDEKRYFDFERPRQQGQVFDVHGRKVGIQICHDIWEDNPVDITGQLKDKGAEIVVNLSASPFSVDRYKERERLVKEKSAAHEVTLIYANAVGAQEHLIFDGQSMIAQNGEIVARGGAFGEEMMIYELEQQEPRKIIEIPRQEQEEEEQIYEALVLGIKEYFRLTKEDNGIEKAIIGLSGGIDSAVVAALITAALGPDKVIGVSMPSQYSSKGSVTDARELAQNLGITFKKEGISPTFKSLISSITRIVQRTPKDLTQQNAQARNRGAIVMGVANEENALVINTGNKTEIALGYCTIYGDMVGAIAPIGDVNKLRVYSLAKYINRRAGKEIIPIDTITKPPSAELTENQTDEASLGVPYETLSPLVDELLEKEPDFASLELKYGKDLVDQTWTKITNAEFKRRQGSLTLRITPRAMGSAMDRRYPLSHTFRRDY
jgi:NAD+ synthase (glutamine-hydrolysing)